jgi:hypothetical protein
LHDYKSLAPVADKDERIKRGLQQLGLEGQKPSTEDDVMKRRKALYANIK